MKKVISHIKVNLLRSKTIAIKTTCIIGLFWFGSYQYGYAQQKYIKDDEKIIYATALSALKFNKAYAKKFAIDDKLLTYIPYYLDGPPNHLVAAYVRENNWNFIKQADLTKITYPFKLFLSKKILKDQDSVIKYDRDGGFNVFSPPVYNLQANRAVVFYQHNEAVNRNEYHGALFFERKNGKWDLVKNISQFELE